MNRDKILKNIKKNITHSVPLKAIDFEPVTYEDPLQTFIDNFLLAGGELSSTEKGVVLKALFGIAENGACLLEEVEDTKAYTFHEVITITLERSDILHNMHEAYKKLTIANFALLMAGPSKTADIEQSLVIGAHGARKVYLLFV